MAPSRTAQRLRVALDMYEVGEELQRSRLRRLDPTSSDEEIESEIRAWRLRRPGAEHGDCPGPPSHRFG